MISFPRIFKPGIIVTLAGQTVQNVPLPQVAVPQGPRITFSITRSMSATPDSAKIAIYNLDPIRRQTMGAIFTELGRSEIAIQAGYDGIMLPLFTGDIRRQKTNERVDADFAFVVEADDGGDSLAECTIRSSTLGLNASQMVDVALLALAQGGQTVGAPGKPITVVKHPSVDAALALAPAAAAIYTSVSIGKAVDFITEAARICGARWYIRDKVLYFAKRGLPTDGLAVVLPRTHWLSEPSEDAKGVVTVDTFCDPNILPGRQIHLEGRTAPGVIEHFRAEHCVYTGDTDSTAPWSVRATLKRITVGA